MRLDSARVWLTGASTGIGAALVPALVSRGARVAITARRSALLDAIAAAHPGSPPPVLPVPGDVTDRIAVFAAADRADRALGGIDLAIFNAGGVVNPVRDTFDADAFVATMALNYFSVVYGIAAVLPGMIARGRGHIAAVSSLAGYRALPARPEYGASKAAVIHLLDSLRLTLAERGVAVTVINPGFVRTPLTAPNRFPMPFLMEPDRAAARIVSGLERDAVEIHFPRRLSWPMKVMRVAPQAIYDALMKVVSSRTRKTQGWALRSVRRGEASR